MIILLELDLYWNDNTNIYPDCSGTLIRLICNIDYPNYEMMKIFCKSVEKLYFYKYKLIIQSHPKFMEK